MKLKKVVSGCSDKLSVAPGEQIEFKVGVEDDADEYRCDIVRLLSTDEHPLGPGLVESVISSPTNRSYPARQQDICPGSYIRISNMPAHKSFTLKAWIWPTLIGTVEQTIIAKGSSLRMNLCQRGALELIIKEQRFTTDTPLLERIWIFIAVSYDAANGAIRLLRLPKADYPELEASSDCNFSSIANHRFEGDVTLPAQGLAHNSMIGHFDGKIDRPRTANQSLDNRIPNKYL